MWVLSRYDTAIQSDLSASLQCFEHKETLTKYSLVQNLIDTYTALVTGRSTATIVLVSLRYGRL